MNNNKVLSVCSNLDVFKYACCDFEYARESIGAAFYKKFGYELTDDMIDEWEEEYQLAERLMTGSLSLFL